MKYILIALIVKTSYFGGIPFTDGSRSTITMQEFDNRKSCNHAITEMQAYFPDSKEEKGYTKLLCVPK